MILFVIALLIGKFQADRCRHFVITAIFSLLHRLRQACDHVALTVKAHLNEDDWNSNVIAAKPIAEEVLDETREDKKASGDTIDNEVSKV